MTSQLPPRLALAHISKRYPGVVANDDVSLSVAPGEIHAVLGENGAGKSTLMKIIFGAVRPDAGEMHFNGAQVTINSPHDARNLGIAMVFQHFSLFDTLTVTENIALGLPAGQQGNMKQLAERIRTTAERYGLPLEPNRHVHTLSVGERQRVEIVRALLANPQLLILDEPTSVLTPQAVDTLFVTLRQLAAEGTSILYISHKLDEIRALCHQATVMRMGKVTGVCDPRQETAASLSRLMIGGEPPRETRVAAFRGPVQLSVQELSLPRAHAFATELNRISLDVHAGEIVGIAGVSGNGQQELLAALSGEDTRAANVSVQLGGRLVGKRDARQRRRAGLAFVPEERLGRGAVPGMSLATNILLSHQTRPYVRRGMISPKAATGLAAAVISRFRVKASGPEALARSLSGGNLQKFIVGREIESGPKVLIVAQPTWGVDVGAAAQIHNEILALKATGCAILVVSEELDELFAICDRLHVIAKGRLSPSVPTETATREQVGLWMSGLWQGGPAQAQSGAEVASHD
ncbi:ABC transport system ATP-binding protein CUT2 family [Cupriavidus necator N-1]|uniref:ABC transport system ATP-binding protein CUT2 family n=1 Tax=Cupriavidus necator (strain ATCC 43291 / DSM 13513 / CCUG 52238 / LMG 8453 / N-1) TaxID=1042878 RepID=G0EYY5_CUPNN|nr:MULTISPECIES: ABC transporter ATP-binding protein [Cupriavidus]AEI76250.1 ABC transport system ATP-binding protein CUT2 family [Cupriavidus necator N-1]MDX6011626.1 ABC transporter ATP-binding protein [Cupriavidus necator]QUN29251.1 ABC transporter ATP-binding protein [Cupriavidus sp. KK10]